MPSTYSQNLRIELIASGEQGNTWGNTTNNNLGTLIEQAISGYNSISTIWSGNACTLVALNGANDQARNMFLEIPNSVSLSAEGQLTAPTVPKMYVIKNASSGGFAVRIKTGTSATSCLIPNGTTKVVVCDGTEFYEATTAAADFYIANAPTLASQATNKSYVDTADDLRLKRDGSQNMTGELVLSAGTAPSNALGAVSRQYVQATFLPLTGGTLSGALTLPSVAPSSTWQAVPKTYVDSLIPGIATTSSLGTIKVGSGLSVAVDGTLSATGTAGVTTVAGTSPILVNGASGSPATGTVTLAMAANAYYPYTGNPSGFVTSAGSVAFATNAGSASTASSATTASTATNATNATTATRLNGSYSYTFSDPTYASTSAIYSLVFGGTTKAMSVGCTNNSANVGAAMQVGRTNSTNTAGTDGAAISFFYGPSASPGSVTITSSATSYNTSSDYRLKENQVPLANALARVAQLKPYRGNFKVSPEKTVDFFFAHEVTPVVPEAINGTKDEVDAEGNPVYQGIDQAKLVPLLTAAIQELNAKVTALTAEVEALKGA